MRAVLTLALACAALPALPAEAQLLKKLKKPAARVLPSVVTGSAGGGVRTAELTFDDKVLEITAERLAAFVKGLEAEVAMVDRVEAQDHEAIERANDARRKEWDRQYEAYTARKAVHQACSDSVSTELRKEQEGLMPGEAQRARMEAVGKRMEAAKARGDLAEVSRLADSLMKATAGVNRKLMEAGFSAEPRLLARCGQPPAEPAKPVYTRALDYTEVDRAGLEASGFGDLQYRIFRERVAPFVASGGRTSSMVYTENEVAALTEALPTLEKFAGHLRKY